MPKGLRIVLWVCIPLVLASCTSASSTGATSVPGMTLPATQAGSIPNPSPTLQASGSPKAESSSQVPATWQVFHDSKSNISLAYPPDWTVGENAGQIIFQGAAGESITLESSNASGLSVQDFLNQDQLPNTRCNEDTNPDGIRYRTCFDTLSFGTIVYLVVEPPQGQPQFYTLTTYQIGAENVLAEMLATIHSNP